MTNEEAIKELSEWLNACCGVEEIEPTREALRMAIEALKAQTPCGDAVSRQTLQNELALYPIDDITSEDEAGYNRAINDVQKMVLHLPSVQPEAAIPITWLEKHIEWLRSFDNDIATFTAGNIIGTIAKWRGEQDD